MPERHAEIARHAAPDPAITLKEVAQSIGWLDVMQDGDLEFSSADWSNVAETGEVTLEGRKGDLLVWASVQIKEVTWERDWDLDDEEEDDDE